MLKIVFDLSQFESVEIVPIADTHVGNILCDIQALHDTISYVMKEPTDPKCARICLLNGDLTESVTRQSVGNIFDMTMTPQVQVATMIEMLKPLSEPSEKYPQGKILSYCGGNHDTDRYKDTGITAAESIACALGLEDRYSPNGCYSFITLRRIQNEGNIMRASVYNQHMTGGGSTVGGKANRVVKAGLGGGILADVVVGSHVHQPMTFKEDVIVPYWQKAVLSQKTVTYVITNSFLRYGDYSQKMGMKPSTITVPRIFIRQKRVGSNSDRLVYTEVIL